MNLEFILPFFKKNKDFFSEYQKYQITLADERKLFFIEEFQLKKKKNVAGITALENHHFAILRGIMAQTTIESSQNN